MSYIKLILSVLAVSLFTSSVFSQRIFYSEPDRDDTKRTNFDIIGKVGQHLLVFKNNRNDNAVSVYDNEMKLIGKEDVNPRKERWINVDFIPYSDFTWMIYQYQQKSIVYCMAVRLDENGKRMTEPIELDTTRIGWAADNKIYTTVFSDDKQQMMIFKINSRNQKIFHFYHPALRQSAAVKK